MIRIFQSLLALISLLLLAWLASTADSAPGRNRTQVGRALPSNRRHPPHRTCLRYRAA